MNQWVATANGPECRLWSSGSPEGGKLVQGVGREGIRVRFGVEIGATVRHVERGQEAIINEPTINILCLPPGLTMLPWVHSDLSKPRTWCRYL